MALRLARTTLHTWIFATTKTDGHAARSVVGVKFALTTATDRFARSVVGGAFVITTANGPGARIAVEAAFALTIAYGTAALSASLKLGSKKKCENQWDADCMRSLRHVRVPCLFLGTGMNVHIHIWPTPRQSCNPLEAMRTSP